MFSNTINTIGTFIGMFSEVTIHIGLVALIWLWMVAPDNIQKQEEPKYVTSYSQPLGLDDVPESDSTPIGLE